MAKLLVSHLRGDENLSIEERTYEKKNTLRNVFSDDEYHVICSERV